MSTIVLFHSALGLRPAVHRFADTLREDGHTVHTPDLFDGDVFDRLDDGVAKRDALGIPELMQRASAAVQDLPNDVVYAGFSMGAASAQWLGATRPGARGVVLMHGCVPLAAMGLDVWPREVPGQIHTAEVDPWVDGPVVDALEAQGLSVFRYPGEGHLFADDDAPEYHAESARLMAERVRSFLRE